MLKTFKTHKESRLGRWRRIRQLQHGLPANADRGGRVYLVDADRPDSKTSLTYSEQAEFLNARAAIDTIEDDANTVIIRALRGLARSAGTLTETVTEHHRLHKLEVISYGDRERFKEQLNATASAREARHLPPMPRLGAIALLGLVDVVAFRAAAAFVLDAEDGALGFLETLVFALISLSTVMMTAYGADRIRALLDVKAEHPDDSEVVRAARRDLRTTGIPLLAFSVAALIAAALLRLEPLDDTRPFVKFLVVVFSLASLGGAAAIELKYANKHADTLDHLTRVAKRAARELKAASRQLVRAKAHHAELEVEATTVAAAYETRRSLQADIAAQRIATIRALRHDLFHPLGPDLKNLIELRLKEHKKIIDVPAAIADRKLGSDTIIAEAEKQASLAYGPITNPLQGHDQESQQDAVTEADGIDPSNTTLTDEDLNALLDTPEQPAGGE